MTIDTINDGGPAFPLKEPLTSDYLGMPLRDYFAAKAIPCACKYWMEDYYHPQSENGAENEERTSLTGSVGLIAEYAYDLADAMLAARDRK
jgi:hypothetical protein